MNGIAILSRHFRVALVAGVVLAWGLAAPTIAQDPMMMDEGGMAAEGMGGMQPQMDPPWHGNVRGQACGPACRSCELGCHRGGKFHADPCQQLYMKHHAYQKGLVLPPCFPRLHTFFCEGWMPTPKPIALPRCHNCGAPIENGF